MTQTNTNGRSTADKGDDLQRVRDILFGAEQHRTSERFGALEQRLEQQVQKLQAEAKATQERLEQELARLRSDTDKQRAELAAHIEKKLAELRDGKLNRGDLAEMLGGMMSRLGAAAQQAGG